ncbi:MAG: glycosyltransferase family 4 protein [Phycisphaerales bacterium]|jgi:glycosyltransferase involved in cell wall biosynthesis|nr:glycosyltransferase family 4 protein [Phycisphaerales bacterium]
MRQPRAIWLVRENLLSDPGGDTTQILETKAALERLGCAVRLESSPEFDASGCDLVHLFHLDRLWEHMPVVRRLFRFGLPAVLSTIYWPGDEFDARGRLGLQGFLSRTFGPRVYPTLRLLQRQALHSLRHASLRGWGPSIFNFETAVQLLLGSVRVILPNSNAELDQIRGRFGAIPPAVVVPNAADTKIYNPPAPDSPNERAGVLCVGRIEPRKNQLALIRALAGTGVPLTLVGKAGRFSAEYHRQCLAAAGPSVTVLDHRSPRELRDLYHRSCVHACVSWYETPGLASLEAGCCGCALVTTPGGCTHEYFGDAAHMCDPADTSSIRDAVMRALRSSPEPALALRLSQRFTWDQAALATLRGYRVALGLESPADQCSTITNTPRI